MDRFTRVYSIILGALAVLLLVVWVKSSVHPEVWKLDAVLTGDQMLASYPYQFRVRAFENGVATISTPRSFDVPAIQFLQIIHPNLAGLAQDDPKMIAAQQDLIDHQKRAMGLITAQDGVDSVTWQLDTQWLADHGVQAPSPAQH